jgi:hypothetical protein
MTAKNLSIFLVAIILSATGCINPVADSAGNGEDSTETPVQFSVITGVTGEGFILLDPDGGTYDEGSAILAEAIPDFRWSFDGWGGDLSGSANPAELTMDGDKDISASFSEFAWQGGQIVDADTGDDARVPVVGVDGEGNAIVAFQQITAGTERIYAAVRTDGVWGAAEIIDAGTGADHAVNPAIAVSSDGTAVVVYHTSFTAYNVYAVHYDGSAWGTPVEIDAGSENALDVDVAIDADGNAVAAFWQRDNTYERIYASDFDGSSWGTATDISAGDFSGTEVASVAMTPTGEAFVFFGQRNTDPGRAYVSRYNGTTWEAAEIVDGGAPNGATPVDIAYNANGTAAAIFRKSVSGITRIFVNIYNGGSWGTPTAIDPDDGVQGTDPRIALDNDGNIFAAYLREFDSEAGEVGAYAAVYSGGTWSASEEISSPLDATYGEVRSVRISADGNGGAVAAFDQMEGSAERVYVSTYENGAWTAPVGLDDVGNGASEPDLAAGPEGQVTVVYQEWDSTWTSRVTSNRLE